MKVAPSAVLWILSQETAVATAAAVVVGSGIKLAKERCVWEKD